MLARVAEEKDTLIYDVRQDESSGGRTPENEYTPSDITSILSEDYLSELELTPQALIFPDSVRKARWTRWCTILQQVNHWNIKFFKLYTPSFLHSILMINSKKRILLKNDIEVANSEVMTMMKQSTNNTIKCLDGLRGVACLFVFNFHFLYPFTKTVIHGYGAPMEDGSRIYTFAHQMPYLSIVYRGRAMVSIFFAISGYVLSHKVLRNTHSCDIDSARRSLTSSTFRRALRLYIPSTISMLLVMIMVWAGLFLSEDQIYSGEYAKYVTGSWEEHPPRMTSLSEQITHWFLAWVRWSNPFDWKFYYNQYDPHTWSIPIEFRSSIVLFAVLLGTVGMQSRWRMLTAGLMVLYCLQLARWDIAIFIGGMLVCEIDIAASTESTASQQPSTCNDVESTPFFSATRLRIDTNVNDFEKYRNMRNNRAKSDQTTLTLRFYSFLVLKWIAFFISLYLLSYPEHKSTQTPGYSILAKLTPATYSDQFLYLFWHALGAIAIVFSVTNIYPLRLILECAPFQYFGRISFSLYLVHGPILHSVGFMLMPEIFKATGYNGEDNDTIPFRFLGALALGWVALFCLSVWCADLFWRFVDIPSTKLARWVEKLLSEEKN